MGHKIVADTEYLLDTSKKIKDTSSEIASSINSLRKIASDLNSGNSDQNMQNFNTNFGDYLTKLNALNSFYDNVCNTISNLAKEYDTVDNDQALDLKKSIDNVEINS